jgi:hypothetical protein
VGVKLGLHRLNVFENTKLREIFVPKRNDVTGEWRRLHNEERYYLCLSPNIIRVIKLRAVKWAGHIAIAGDRRDA